ncbi:hypothetical protein [Aeoliella sp. SH292]|uniref:hypothetical protein n=1 Tax=Aeoliella sp. SH292 TaxID=3454464 RepID=UPI003F99510C
MNDGDSFLNRYFDPLANTLTAESARSILALEADESVRQRVAELGEKSNAGQLSEDEREEYRALASAGTLISILKAKARRILANRPA